ncbi:hypothetical protein DACRYDRAFT_115557 [Dacryopinax primogenitus]|uniref:Cell morphogenesis protein N-terminal domain-containing protein n=1 Tax=Dacryopinax primogenitus (strain DJM 731) TaxID=1858805 RepID=M5G3Z1_DACPD|nr:uncharacterized protein DACRYDRAFT_115557 [Dacryopinax primogenitus]EJU03394.1 hypothetical protein DACRYDRAFT_115557 [Dacryopinax primogenitus]
MRATGLQTAVGVDEAVGLGAAAVGGEGEPRTPGELVLHVVFTQFVAKVEDKMRKILDFSLEKDPSVASVFGRKVDPTLDALLLSLAHIAVCNAGPVVEAIMPWRKTQRESVPLDIVEKALQATGGKGRMGGEARGILNQRKHVASIYVFSRALLVLIQTMTKDSPPSSLATQLEHTIFAEYRDLDPRALAQSSNWKSIGSLYSEVLGAMADAHFESVTDEFLTAISSLSSDQGETDARVEHLLRGLKHVKLRVWQPEAFEEAAEFLAAFAGQFANAHGQSIKTAFAEALTGPCTEDCRRGGQPSFVVESCTVDLSESVQYDVEAALLGVCTPTHDYKSLLCAYRLLPQALAGMFRYMRGEAEGQGCTRTCT